MRLAALATLLVAAPAAISTAAPTVTKIYFGENSDTGVRRADLDGTNQELLYLTPGGSRIDIAVDPLNQHIYFPSNTAGGIQRSSLDGSNPELAVSVPMTNGIDTLTVDSVNRKVYWSDSYYERHSQTPSGINAIWRSNMDGSGRELLFEGLPRITAIEIDPAGGNFYWADFYTGMIRRTTLDNSRTDVIFDEHTFGVLPYPTGLAVDPAGGHLYASDTALHAIVKMDLDGGNPTILVDGIGVRSPESIAFDPVGQRIYWANWAGSYNTHTIFDYAIMSAKLDGTDIHREFFARSQGGNRALVRNLAIVQVPVPEPNTVTIAVIGAMAFLLHRRRALPG